MHQTRKGFTIVELLIVIVVISILAAISVTAYTGIQNRASDTSVRADLSAIAKKFELYRVTNETYPAVFESTLTEALGGYKVSRSAYAATTLDGSIYNIIYCTNPGRSNYGIAAWSASGQGYAIINNTVQEFNYTVAYSATTCPRMVSPFTSDHVWFRGAGSWRSYI